jgi:hypothetical protein
MASEDKPTPEAELRNMLQKTLKSKKELSKVGDGIKKSNSNIKMPNKWISYVKEYAKTHNLKYNEWDFFVFTKKFNFKQRKITTYYCDSNPPPLYVLYSQYTFFD